MNVEYKRHANGFYNKRYTRKLNNLLLIPSEENIKKTPIKNLPGHLNDYIAIHENCDKHLAKDLIWEFDQVLEPETIKEDFVRSKIKKKVPLRTLKIRIIPNKLQEQFLKVCMEESRITKNKAYIEINKMIKDAKTNIKNERNCVFCDKQKEIYKYHGQETE